MHGVLLDGPTLIDLSANRHSNGHPSSPLPQAFDPQHADTEAIRESSSQATDREAPSGHVRHENATANTIEESEDASRPLPQ